MSCGIPNQSTVAVHIETKRMECEFVLGRMDRSQKKVFGMIFSEEQDGARKLKQTNKKSPKNSCPL